jgi:hypothetical protein
MIDDVTVCIPTIPGREALLARAVASARDQAAVVVNNGDGRVDLAYLNWWQAIYSARTKYVGLLFDDDWYGPTFVARTRERMSDSVAWVATNATIHLEHKTRANIFAEPSATWDTTEAVGRLLGMDYTITPSCVLMRREDALGSLLVGGVPARKVPIANAGGDVLLLLFSLLGYPSVEWIEDELVNLDGGNQSTTVREMQKGNGDLINSYRLAKSFFATLMRGLHAET